MTSILSQFYSWCWPRVCVACGLNSEDLYLDLCKYCTQLLPWLDERCYCCGERLNTADAIVCGDCLQIQPPFMRLCALFTYDPPIKQLINQLKFRRDLYPGKLFAELLLQAVRHKWYVNKPLPQAIIPVPLHITRQRYRGYNQALEISLPISKALNIPVDLNICQRIRHTPPQAKLNKEQRATNLTTAFYARTCAYDHVVLVDDVVTTCSTVRAVSNALVAAGVQHVEVWCVCRA